MKMKLGLLRYFFLQAIHKISRQQQLLLNWRWLDVSSGHRKPSYPQPPSKSKVNKVSQEPQIGLLKNVYAG